MAAKVLFLHGLDARPGGKKPCWLLEQGFSVANPALPREDFAASVDIARQAFQADPPDVVVGSSRGGAVALALGEIAAPLVLVAPAWRFYRVMPRVGVDATILHSPADEVIPIDHSKELLRLCGLPESRLVEVGSDHSMNDPEALLALREAVANAL